MDHRSAKDEDAEIDLESGLGRLAVTEDEDDSRKLSTPCTAKQGTTLFAKMSCGLVVKDSIKSEDSHKVYCNESNLSGVYMDVVKVTNKSLAGQDSADFADKTPLKERRKKSSNKKAPKPPRPPRTPSLDAADLKLVKEISELAMLKRARIERMKALKKMKSAKSTSSSSSSMFAMIFTVIFCIVIILQGMSPGKSSVASFGGSPVPAGKPEAGMIVVQDHLNPSSSDPNALGFDSHNYAQQVTGSDLPVKLRRDAH